jgi:uncharacterized protein YndB with AHSA1/START domain
MAKADPADPRTSLEVRQTIRAPRERVFRAWTRPEEVSKWSAPGAMTVSEARIDLRVGGRFRIEMQEPNGTRHPAVGEYREVTPPERLVYTWSWENEDHADGSVITVEFLDRGGSTEVVLRHDHLKDAASRDKHREGWVGCVEKLATLF